MLDASTSSYVVGTASYYVAECSMPNWRGIFKVNRNRLPRTIRLSVVAGNHGPFSLVNVDVIVLLTA